MHVRVHLLSDCRMHLKKSAPCPGKVIVPEQGTLFFRFYFRKNDIFVTEILRFSDGAPAAGF
jgi:hypothetical protein